MIQSWDADGHVEEWEGTFSDAYLDPAFRDRRPAVVDPKGDGHFMWQVPGRAEPFKFGGSPTSRGDVPSLEQSRLKEWRGTVASAEFRGARPRLDLMDAEHITLQVNYPTMLLYWPVAPDPSLNQAFARAYNNWMAGVSDEAPDRMKWVSVVDFHSPEEAAREVRRTKAMGSLGVMVPGVVGEKPITDAVFEPIWAAAAETDMAVAVHPMVAGASFDDAFHLSVLAGFKHVCTSGILDRHPDVRVGFLETSCTWVEFALWRADETLDAIVERKSAGIDPGRALPMEKPDDYLRSGRLFVGFEAEDAMLPYVVNRWGPDIWLYASDIPHAHRILDATNHIAGREDLSPEVRRKLLVDNTARFYGLPAAVQTL